MAKKISKHKAIDPLAHARIAPPRTADEAKADAAQVLADAAIEAAEAAAEAPSVTETAATAARVRTEKQLVVAPAKALAKKMPCYTVLNDQTVYWRGQQLRLKKGKSIISDERQGSGAVAKFRAMGVKLEEIK